MKRNAQIVLAKCDKCGMKVPFVYLYEQRDVKLWGTACTCPDSTFTPYTAPPPDAWLAEQDELRGVAYREE